MFISYKSDSLEGFQRIAFTALPAVSVLFSSVQKTVRRTGYLLEGLDYLIHKSAARTVKSRETSLPRWHNTGLYSNMVVVHVTCSGLVILCYLKRRWSRVDDSRTENISVQTTNIVLPVCVCSFKWLYTHPRFRRNSHCGAAFSTFLLQSELI